MKFNWFGTIDFSGWFSAPESLEYRKSLGDDAIYEYNHNLALLAANYIADLLNTQVLGSPSQVGFMSNVELPINEPYSFDLQFKIEQHILKEYGLRLKLFHFKDKWYIRLSAQLNLCFEDFKLAGKALKRTLELNLNEL
ncbi:hypothetical protein CONCODRAFT_128263 [Conidiobolus coronatus NRRL 28638]|uniref:PLP-dependent transferase n=1 Tax=Conidiobolus coronatus (strain ATCC 28846 / CBS 209.66 / NRRL 28638) TaxID=796925 RepID=A0A137NUL5_CONC2|nr:hypothetical protein CONCODRAFT_128263 [Conidiobolus coronatus NRRL 28638]|eukprot:KXN66493.1 hypothetical protein CONCODRAFT_128263 [Conidiobolus coronatus NRRL 28638]